MEAGHGLRGRRVSISGSAGSEAMSRRIRIFCGAATPSSITLTLGILRAGDRSSRSLEMSPNI